MPTRQNLTYLALLLAVAAMLDLFVALSASPTTDEWIHLRYGTHILQHHADRTYGGSFDSQMPLSAFNALPGVIGAALDGTRVPPRIVRILINFKTARFATIFGTLLLTIAIYFWAYDLYGSEAALGAALLCVLSPNIIAHGTLATTDLYGAMGATGALFFFHRFLVNPTTRNAVWSGLVLALAQITKSFDIFLYAIVGVFLLYALLRRIVSPELTPKKALAFAAICAAWFVAVLNVAYRFDRTFTPLDSYHFRTGTFHRLQQLPVIGAIPVPIPYPFLQGLDMMKDNDATGAANGNVYLLGQLGSATDPQFRGFKSYYAVVMFFKEPIALQILFVWGILWIVKNRRLGDLALTEGPLLLAATLLFLWLSLFSRTQIGIRYILLVLAMEIVVASAAFRGFSSAGWVRKTCLCGLILWLGISVARYYPQMIPYMNEWAGDRRQVFRLIADSNLDWGQDGPVVEEFLRKNPDVLLNPPKPVSGRILVSANRLTGVERWQPPATYYAQFQPVAQVGYAHFLFDVPANDLPADAR